MRYVISLKTYCEKNGLTTLLSEYSIENPFAADQIGFKSTTPCTWVCSHGHTEEESPFTRVRRGYCKTCGKEQGGSFGQKYPQLLPYWSPENNKLPFDVSPRNSALVRWCCPQGHSWERSIPRQIAAASVCPYCKSRDNALFEKHPELLREWDWDLNEERPETVSSMSRKQYHWICSGGHRFTASPDERTRRHKGCTVCKSLLTKYPLVAMEWHPTKNSFGPDTVTPASHKEAWFICRSCSEDYICEIVDRVRRKGDRCMHCR